MTKYSKRLSDFFYVPYNPQENFLNSSGGTIQSYANRDIVPYALITDDLPIILPKRADESVSSISGGRNKDVVLESQFEVGAGSIPNVAKPLQMIPRLCGDVTVTHSGAEVWTIVAGTAASITTGTYFSFDVINASGVTIKYAAWFDKNGDGTTDKPTAPDCYDPVSDTDDGINQSTAQGKRELVQIDISGDTSAQEVADAITSAITALSDVSAANGGGTTTTVTVTNGSNGAVMDAHDNGSCGLTIAVTTQGYTDIKIEFDADSTENTGYFGYQFQRNNGSYDTIYDIVGCSVAEHSLKVEMGEGDAGVMKEDVAYMMAGVKEQYGALTMLTRPRDQHGNAWTKNWAPFGNTGKAHGWHTVNGNETFTYNSVAVNVAWFGWEIFIENDLSHNYDGGGSFASAVDFNNRNIKITIDVQPEDYTLFQLSRDHIDDYTGDLLIQLKSELADGVQYVQFDCDKLRVLPFDEESKADGSPEQYSIELEPAPAATTSYTIRTYTPAYYYGVTA